MEKELGGKEMSSAGVELDREHREKEHQVEGEKEPEHRRGSGWERRGMLLWRSAHQGDDRMVKLLLQSAHQGNDRMVKLLSQSARVCRKAKPL